MERIIISSEEHRTICNVLNDAKVWAYKHKLSLGLLEMTLGASCITWGVHNGVIEMGKDVVASAFSQDNLAAEISGILGGGLGAIGSAVLGNIGIAAMGTAIGIPAWAIIGGGALLLGAVSYAGVDLAVEILHPSHSYWEFLGKGSIMVVGVALLVDGARRMLSDEQVQSFLSEVRGNVIHLAELGTRIVATTKNELTRLLQEQNIFKSGAPTFYKTTAATTVGAITGASLVGAAATSAVTVAGSHALGVLALALGLVSVPLLPVIIGGAGLGMAAGYMAWDANRRFP